MSAEQVTMDRKQFAERVGIDDYKILTDAGWMTIYNTTKRNALKRGIPFALSVDEFKKLAYESRYQCAITGIYFDCSEAQGKRRPWFPSIDRIKSSEGYTKNNCRLVCVAVNLAMNEWGEEVLMRIVRALIQRDAAKRRAKVNTDGLGNNAVLSDVLLSVGVMI